jgi:hypothetical protein
MTRRSKAEREPRVFSASSVLDELAEALSAIRREDRLTFTDMAAVLGRSDDQAAKYCAGSQAMDVVTFARARKEWNGRFTGGLDRLIAECRHVAVSDRACGSKVLKAALALSEALEGDEEIIAAEVRKNRGTLEAARDAIDAQLAKLGPKRLRK